MTIISERMDNGHLRTIAYQCDLTGERVEKTDDLVWFEPTLGKPKDPTQYDLFSCAYCERFFSRKALDTLRWSFVPDRDDVSEFYCGECENELGIFRLRRKAHGMMLGYRMTDDKFLVPHFTRLKRYGDSYPLPDDATTRYKRGLQHRMEEWLGKRDEARVTEFSLFDMTHNEKHGWCVEVEDTWTDIWDGDQAVAQGFNRFMDYFSAHFTHYDWSWNRWGQQVGKRAFGCSGHYDFRVRIYDWRMHYEDGIGGFNAPVIFQVMMYSGESHNTSITVLCNSESYGQDDRWDNTDSFNALDLYMAMVEHMGLRYIQADTHIQFRGKATITPPKEE